MRRTKIICTLGPASSSPEQISALIGAGMDIARVNFSHGTHEQHAELIKTVRDAATAMNKHVGIMCDLQGPKIRVGALVGGKVELVAGANVTISTDEIVGTAARMSTVYEHFAKDVKPGDPVLLADGLMRLMVESVSGNDVLCTVIDGGVLSEHQGINLPSSVISAPSLSEKDIDDLLHGLSLNIEYVALSFVRTAQDVLDLRHRITEAHGDARIVAKIERGEAVKAIKQIVDVADAVMVARGDLGVEMPPQAVPLIQKKIIRACNLAAVPVITATQMLESMILNPRPTRAEASDVANAVLDGSDAVMLSGETATGAHPLEAVRIMSDICVDAEQDLHTNGTHTTIKGRGRAMEHSVAQSACILAEELGASAVLCLTRSGTTARLLSQCRPTVPVIAMTDDAHTARRVAMYWGVESIVIPNPRHTEDALQLMCDAAKAHGFASHGDTVVITGGHPLTMKARTNFVKVEKL